MEIVGKLSNREFQLNQKSYAGTESDVLKLRVGLGTNVGAKRSTNKEKRGYQRDRNY